MPKQMLSGTLDEQCEFLYNLALDKMEQGSYTGAIRALQEIVRYAPDYRDAAQLLQESRARKAESRWLIVFAFLGGIVMIGVGTLFQASNDAAFLALALAGAGLGYLAGIGINRRRRGPRV
ncbi:MAG: hypothetical protein QM346_10715 [Chloroflexota bacterium]|jgi:tetratricopeptide (TPR) repeat protein|nr:hypothetical protein [Chloroflexota bacterium]